MTLYTVHAPVPAAGETAPDPLALVFVKEGFCWPALLIPGPWLIFRRMWLVLALYVALTIGLLVLGNTIGGAISLVLTCLLRLLFAIEGNGLRRFTLEGMGYRLLGVVEGRNLGEAELRWFIANPGPAPAAPTDPTEIAAPVFRPAQPVEVVGLFPAAGG